VYSANVYSLCSSPPVLVKISKCINFIEMDYTNIKENYVIYPFTVKSGIMQLMPENQSLSLSSVNNNWKCLFGRGAPLLKAVLDL
jgi:hypothetical protein